MLRLRTKPANAWLVSFCGWVAFFLIYSFVSGAGIRHWLALYLPALFGATMTYYSVR